MSINKAERYYLERYCQLQHLSQDDFDSEAAWEEYKATLTNVIYNLLTIPIHTATKYALDDGWTWKQFKVLVELIATDEVK